MRYGLPHFSIALAYSRGSAHSGQVTLVTLEDIMSGVVFLEDSKDRGEP